MTTYASSGVNIELGDASSRIMYEAAKATWANRKGLLGEVVSPKDDFSGVRVIDVSGLPEGSVMCMGFDGVGTKVELAERMQNHSTAAFDLFAMVCDDAVVCGGEPVLVGSILDVKSLGTSGEGHLDFMRQLAEGYISAAAAARVAVINGEIAELGARISGYGDFNYNWGAAVIWFARKDRLFTGAEIRPGDSVISLREKGFRSNGLSLLRKIMKDNYGDDWHTKELPASAITDGSGGSHLLGDLALVPSTIYAAAVCDMFGGFAGEPKLTVHGVAHITGGGIPGKLGRVLRRANLGANLNALFPPCDLMAHAIEIGKVDKDEAYRSWNMGNGMLVIVPQGEEQKALSVAAAHGIEAKICGEITEEKEIKIG
ncbi:MAG: AIR synthase-related protein [Candidatus Gracilibacteria bacterium]